MTSEEIKGYDGMRGAGRLYHTSAVFLQDMSPIIMKLAKGKMPVDLNANIVSSILLYALSAEIALKALIKKEGLTIPHLHDLKSLYEALPQTTRQAIKDKLIGKYPEFDTLSDENKKSFIEWRYFYEEGANTAAISFLRDFSNEVNLICTNVSPS